MSNREEGEYSQLDAVIRFAFAQLLKEVHSHMPGVVRAYDATTRRAEIEPALRTVLTDGTTMNKPVIVDVPVVMPYASGYTLTLPVAAGDTVILFFSERGITEFKSTLDVSDPDDTFSFAMRDAMALCGFVNEVTAADGIALQDVQNTKRVSVNDNNVEVVNGSQSVTLNGSNVAIVGNTTVTGNLTVSGTSTLQSNVSVTGNIAVSGNVDGVDVGSHRHAGRPATAPGQFTGPPVP